ncbi:MAG: hypothetical protein AB2821_15015 [Candidatus Thiodiazotropha endolucinida]
MHSSGKRTTILPVCGLTETCEESDPGATKQVIPKANGVSIETHYFTRQLSAPDEVSGLNYNLLPVVLDCNDAPWDVANIYILSRLQAVAFPEMTTIAGIADDIGAYKEFLDEKPDIDFTCFPQNKLKRPTYRYNGYLKQKLFAGEVEASTVKRRMSSVVAFYRWMIQEKILNPDNDPWQEREYLASFNTAEGFNISKSVKSTDLSIKAPVKDIPHEGTILDGGRLRPLAQTEQLWILEALNHIGNTELMLIHLVALLTGGRIQTVLTIRLSHVSETYPASVSKIPIKCGPRYGIDTKGDAIGVLQVPRQLYELLQTYSKSKRAKNRQNKAPGTDNLGQYLFLTQQGTPYYQAKIERMQFNPDLRVRHHKKGQAVRQFITDRVIPYVHTHHDPAFHYRFHDLRATFGMNETDRQLALVEEGKIKLADARRHVQKLLWHSSSATTDLYLDYRRQMEMVWAAVDDYENHIASLIEAAKSGVFGD